MQNRLNLYILDMKYIAELAKRDDNVMSVSPQAGKASRPFVGIVVVCDNKRYCIPLSSPKPKHEKMRNSSDFSKIYDTRGKLIGVLNFNNMIPVDDTVISPVDMVTHKHDAPGVRHYKALLNNQLDWCNANRTAIAGKAERLYRLVTEHPERARSLVRRCCDFKRLEGVLAKRQSAS